MKPTIAAALTVCGVLMAAFPAGALGRAAGRQVQTTPKAEGYYCVMDPEVKSSRPGKCPKCGMELRPIDKDAEAASPDARLPGREVEPGMPLKLRIPDVTIYDQDGNKLRFVTDLVKGKTVAINFIFTTCTTICPPLAATFRRVQQNLGDRVGRDVRLISISVDPVTDVPERLKAFASKFKAGPGWTFVTGSKFEIDQLLKAMGASVVDKTDHTPMVLVGNDSAGYWTRTYGLAPPAVIARVIADAAGKN